MLTKRRKDTGEEKETVLPTEIKNLMQCKERLLPALESAQDISECIFFTNKFLTVLCLHRLSLDQILSSKKTGVEEKLQFLITA